jgi:hypothetical protein
MLLYSLRGIQLSIFLLKAIHPDGQQQRRVLMQVRYLVLGQLVCPPLQQHLDHLDGAARGRTMERGEHFLQTYHNG